MDIINFFLPMAQAHGTDDSFGHHMMGYGMFGFGFLGPIMMVLFWAIVISAIILLVRYFAINDTKDQSQKPADRSLGILKERYAKGEIEKEEFKKKKQDLE